jgi:hypothetical protein
VNLDSTITPSPVSLETLDDEDIAAGALGGM